MQPSTALTTAFMYFSGKPGSWMSMAIRPIILLSYFFHFHHYARPVGGDVALAAERHDVKSGAGGEGDKKKIKGRSAVSSPPE